MGTLDWAETKTGEILLEVYTERERQEELKRQGKFLFTCADNISQLYKLAILCEEVGEIAKEIVEFNITLDKYSTEGAPIPPHREIYYMERIKKELIQVAAVCTGWAESI